ncbi:HNH/endonuclease VII fold toxin-2 domain-containing protein [Diaphorobacter caeni]|uniref:HNH/endonuclease VII fold toxin-2 domain-containing protein n=1 Tax=Diaphorobacter caeni TaxID=2784387 RepID=UPI00188EAC27|nr:HNH/endonuclease VII fold toxin-2 domain-containing protein [Diaphorobacter caeni]MBF5005297.1 hypothetical protein [Diaphorobacter caeni]
MAGPPNTPANIYLDTPSLRRACGKESERIKNNCKKNNKNKSPLAEKLMGKKATDKLNELKKKMGAHSPEWLVEHCDGLWMKPVSPKVSGEIKELGDSLKKMDPDELLKAASESMDHAKALLENALKEIAKDTATKTATKAAGRWGIGALFGPIGAAVATVVNVVDTAITAVEVAGNVMEFRKEIESLKKLLDDFPKALRQLANDAANNPQKAIADAMSIISNLNDCVRARRCQLVPMEETHLGKKPENCAEFGEDEEEVVPTGPATGKGCCPGQTGHHVLPSSMFKDCQLFTNGGKPSASCAHQKAPTVCVEGVNNSHGSHGAIHNELEKLMAKYPNGEITYNQAVDEGVSSVRSVFSVSGCTEKCLRAQLKSFYDKYANCSPLKASSGKGGRGRGGAGDVAV